MESGVGQGCPASAIMFVDGGNPLLMALEAFTADGEFEAVSAYADDIAAVLNSTKKDYCTSPNIYGLSTSGHIAF
jgi:hypothetical protein